MLDSVQINDLSFYNDKGILTLSAKQYDTGRKFIFNIVDNDEPFDLTDCIVYLRMQKPDGTQFQGEECCSIDVSKVIVDTAIGNGDQILSCEGVNNCELHLTDSEGKSLTTWDFIINVVPRVHNADHIESVDSFDILDKVIEAVLQLNEHVNNTNNPHGITKSQIGLDKVENKSPQEIIEEITSDNVKDALGYTPLDSNLKGRANGIAELDVDGKIPNTQLPNMAILNTASGEEIHLTDSAEGKAVEFALYGKSEQNTTTGKNLLENTAVSKTINGITFSVNNDGSVTVNGTATAAIYQRINKITLENNNYILTDGKHDRNTNRYMYVNGVKDGSNKSIVTTSVLEHPSFTVDGTYAEYDIGIGVENGTTISNLTFYPMIRLASIEDDIYEPYTNGASPNPDYPQEIEVSGESYNLLENTEESKTVVDATYTVNDDKSITVSRQSASGTTYVELSAELEKGEYILSGCPSGGSTSSYCNQIYNGSSLIGSDIGSGLTFTLSEKTTLRVIVGRISSNTTVENLTFYPMIRKASVKNDRYMPYGKGSVEVKSVGKNLLNNNAVSYTNNGITYTVNADGSIHMAGKKTGTSYIDILGGLGSNYKTEKLDLKGKFRYATSSYGRLKFRRTDGVYLQDLTTVQDVGCGEIGAVYFEVESSENVDFTYYPQMEYGDALTEYEPYKETLSTIPTPNGLPGIKVSSGGNYTDSNGQQWICDEIVKYADGSGERIQRVVKLNNDEFFETSYEGEGYRISSKRTDVIRYSNVLCSHMTTDNSVSQYSVVGNYISTGESGGRAKVRFERTFADLTECKQYMNDNGYAFYVAITEPIHTPLTAEEIAEIEKMCTFYPVTNILNDAGCGMEVGYFINSPNSDFISDIYNRSHVHNNKTVLDNTTASYTTEEKNKLSEIEDGAKANVQSDWNATSGDAFIKNKPTIPEIPTPVNNLLATVAGSPLDATQGKILNDKIIALQENGSGDYPPYYVGTCSTSASTSAKTVSITGFELKVGAIVHVKFSYTNTSSTATLNISSTGAKEIYHMDGTRMYYIPSDIYHSFIYDGIYWRYLDSKNTIIGAKNYERYGIQMSGSTLQPINSSYRPNLGSSSNRFYSVYSDYMYPNYIYAKTLNTTINGSYVEVLPLYPLMKGHFIISSQYSITLDSEVTNKYVKSYYTGFISTGTGTSGSGCASPCSAYATYDGVIKLRLIGYDTNQNGQMYPFSEDIVLSTSQEYYSSSPGCSGQSTAYKTVTLPGGSYIHIYMTGFTLGCCGYVSGSPTITVSTWSNMVHFLEIDLMP